MSPSAVLTPQEIEGLFRIMRTLVEQGKSIIFITHKLKEVLEIADRITVIRRGKVIGSTTPQEADELKLAQMMVGRAVRLDVEKEEATPGDTVLQVEHLTILDDLFNVAVDDISFDVRSGEILGMAGVQGNGQTELVEALTGLRSAQSGKISLLEHEITNASPRKITEMGSAHIPEDRQAGWLAAGFLGCR